MRNLEWLRRLTGLTSSKANSMLMRSRSRIPWCLVVRNHSTPSRRRIEYPSQTKIMKSLQIELLYW